MKSFSDNFFSKDNFITTQYDYNYLKESQPSCHICYNVNNQFIHIMGVSIISVLENNKEMNLHFMFLRIVVIGKTEKKLELWLKNGIADALCIF